MRMSRRLLAALLLLTFAAGCGGGGGGGGGTGSPEATISGRVLDSDGGPVPGATVTLSDDQATVLTDLGGKFSLTAGLGAHDLFVAFEGRTLVQLVFDVASSEPLALGDLRPVELFFSTPVAWYSDVDGDRYSDGSAVAGRWRPDPRHFLGSELAAIAGDCDDAEASAHPDGTEVCGDGLDNDCDGRGDEALQRSFFRDGDGDGFGVAGESTRACSKPPGYAVETGDCDDARTTSHPGALEICNALDDDCDGQVDEGVTATFYRDRDGDGFGAAAETTAACLAPAGYVAAAGDCDDGVASVHPGASEACNGVDDDCDGQVDEGVTATFYRDGDGDGFGAAAEATTACSAPVGYAAADGDCDDGAASVHPGASEACNGVDDDCDDTTVDGTGESAPLCTLQDGVCAGSRRACAGGSWRDAYAGIDTYETVEASCDGVDNDCDGQADEGLTAVFYRDADADGFGTAAESTRACSAPAGYAAASGDCDDQVASVHPGASETCDGVDNDCNAATVDGSAETPPLCTLQDGMCLGSRQTCSGGGWTDSYGGIGGYEAVEASCDGVDNDCDGQADEGLKAVFYRDADGDGFGAAAESATACSAPPGYVAQAGDCDDAVASVHPEATDVCRDGVDQNCDGEDASCTVVTFEKTYGGVHCEHTWNVEQTPDLGYVIAGYEHDTTDGVVHSTLYAIKTDEYGQETWKQEYSDSVIDYGRVVVHQTADGGYAILGTDWYDMFLLKTDTSGSKQWIKYYGSTGAKSGFDFKVTSEGGFIMVGEEVTISSSADIVLVKAGAGGEILWSTTISYPNYERAYDVIETADGGYALVGHTNSIGAGHDDVFLAKCDAQGAIQWQRTYGTAGWDWGTSLEQTYDKGYVLAGYTNAGSQDDVYLVKTDEYGVSQWVATFGGSSSDSASDVRQTDDRGYLLVGSTASFGQGKRDVYLIKTSPTGAEEWSRLFGGAAYDFGIGVEFTRDGGYAVVGTTESMGAGSADVYLLKTDVLGRIAVEYCRDGDADGYGDGAACVVSVEPVAGHVANSGDCDDSDPAVHPGAAEIPADGLDQDCDGRDASLFYRDADGDRYGAPGDSVVAASAPPGYVADASDCDDTRWSVHPGAGEVCGDGIDQNCDGSDLTACLSVFYRDADGDGYGNARVSVAAASPPPGYVADASDCDDTRASVHPGADEVCSDGIDQDCDGSDPQICMEFYCRDVDGDGFGNPDDFFIGWPVPPEPPEGYVADCTDCDDGSLGVHPGRPEIPGDGVDQDCDGLSP